MEKRLLKVGQESPTQPVKITERALGIYVTTLTLSWIRKYHGIFFGKNFRSRKYTYANSNVIRCLDVFTAYSTCQQAVAITTWKILPYKT